MGRIAEIVNLGHAPRAPIRRARDQKGDPGIAFPPALVRVLELIDDDRDAGRLLRRGHVPDFMRGVAESAKEINFAGIRLGQRLAVADAHHLRAATFALTLLAGYVREILRPAWIGHVNERSAVLLLRASERIQRAAAVMPDLGDPAAALLVDHRLIGAAPLQVVGAD